MNIIACHSCTKGVGKHCETCRRVSQDDIRIAHSPHNRSELQATTIHEPSEQATALPPDVEDTLRRLLCTITGFKTLDILLLVHIAKGGTPSNFGRAVNALMAEARTYGPEIGRATAMAKWKAIVKRFAPFRALRSWGIGHGGRMKTETDEPKLQQGELWCC